MGDDISPYIEEKDVVLCRSGMQLYRREELINAGMDLTGHEDKDTFVEYRPPYVIVKAKKLYKKLPVTKEHPSEWVTPENFSLLAGGVTGSDVEVETLESDDICLKSTLTFYTKKLHDYYLKGNKEVSCGYKLDREWVDNPKEKGYDLVLKKIKAVNHVAITAKGRGGVDVTILDSIVGGMKKMRTGIIHYAKNKGKQNDSANSFSDTVFKAIDSLKDANDEDEKATIAASVFDSIRDIKDSEEKTQLMDMVKDTLDDPETAKANKEEVGKVLDSCYISISGSSIQEISDAIKLTSAASVDSVPESTSAEDAEGKMESKKEEEKKDEKKKDKEESSSKDGCSGKKKGSMDAKDSSVDSLDSMADSISSKIVEKLSSSEAFDSLMTSKMKSILGIPETKKSNISGISGLDSMEDTGNTSAADMLSAALQG